MTDTTTDGSYRTIRRDPDAPTWDNCPECGTVMEQLGEPPEGAVFTCADCDLNEVWVKPPRED